MSLNPPTQIILNLTSTYGALLIGVCFTCVLWGIATMQLFMYFKNYRTDRIHLKALATVVWLIDMGNTMIIISALFPVLIVNWGSIDKLMHVEKTLLHHPWIIGIISVTVQTFFVYRIYRFSGKRWPAIWLLVPLAWWQIGAGMAYTYWAYTDTNLSVLSEHRMTSLVTSLRAVTAFVDVIIAILMVYLLLKGKNSEFKQTSMMIQRLIIITVNTGLWTAIAAVVDFVMILIIPNDLWYCILEFPLSSLYVNVLLANLNSRHFVRQADVDPNSCTVAVPSALVMRRMNDSHETDAYSGYGQDVLSLQVRSLKDTDTDSPGSESPKVHCSV